MGRNFTPEVLQALDAPFRNGLAPRGGLAFDGTASTRVYSTLTNQNVGTDAVSLVATFRVPTTAPNDTEVLSISASALGTQFGSSFSISLYGSGAIGILAVNAGATASRSYTVAGFISAYAGKVVTVTAARSANTVLLYINGVAQAGTDTGSGTGVNWSDSITSTYLIAGFRSSSTLYNGTIYAATLYNCALAQADVTEIYESGGAVPERFKFGAQVDPYSATAFTNPNVYDSFTGASTTGFTASATSLAAFALAAKAGVAFGANKTFLLTFTGTLTSGTAPTILALNNIGTTVATIGTLVAGANSFVFSPSGGATSGFVGFRNAVGNSTSYAVASFSIKQLGAVVHLDGDSDGIGYQWHDQSTNKLDAVLTATGVSWTKPARAGYVRETLTWAGTHEAKAVGPLPSLPSGAVINLITAKATVASSAGVVMSSNSDFSRWAVLQALGTTKKSLTLANVLPAGSATTNLDITFDPDTANYTGTVQVEVRYSVTEGTP